MNQFQRIRERTFRVMFLLILGLGAMVHPEAFGYSLDSGTDLWGRSEDKLSEIPTKIVMQEYNTREESSKTEMNSKNEITDWGKSIWTQSFDRKEEAKSADPWKGDSNDQKVLNGNYCQIGRDGDHERRHHFGDGDADDWKTPGPVPATLPEASILFLTGLVVYYAVVRRLTRKTKKERKFTINLLIYDYLRSGNY